MIEAFLNEQSLHAQYADLAQFTEALIQLNGLLHRISQFQVEKRVFFDRQLYSSTVTEQGQIFSSCLDNLRENSVRLQFKIVLRNRLNVTEWRSATQQEECSYTLNSEDIAGSSVAELAERSIRGKAGFLLNFSPSKFPAVRCIVVKKAANKSVTIDSVNTDHDLDEWCQLYPELGLIRYEQLGGRVPLNRETILADRGRFQRTNLRNQGKVAYLERKTNYFFAIDNLHGTHFEVFNSNKQHIGIADLRGVLDRTRAVPGRKMGD
jgi:hypothetical protein